MSRWVLHCPIPMSGYLQSIFLFFPSQTSFHSFFHNQSIFLAPFSCSLPPPDPPCSHLFNYFFPFPSLPNLLPISFLLLHFFYLIMGFFTDMFMFFVTLKRKKICNKTNGCEVFVMGHINIYPH